jgi:hypothetical protein
LFDDFVGSTVCYQPDHFEAFIVPLRPHTTSDQYPLKPFLYFRNFLKELRTSAFEGTVLAVLGRKIPKFRPQRLYHWWNNKKIELVLHNVHSKANDLADIVRKIGTIDLGAEIATLCGIPLSDAITRGSQIRQEGLFGNTAKSLNLALLSPNKDQRAQCGACEGTHQNLFMDTVEFELRSFFKVGQI